MQHHLNQVYGIMKIQNIQLSMDVLLLILRKTQLSTKSVIFHCQNWSCPNDHAENAFCHKNCSTKMRIPMKLSLISHIYIRSHYPDMAFWTQERTVGWMRFCNPLQPFNICSLHVIWFQTSTHFQSPVVPFLN